MSDNKIKIISNDDILIELQHNPNITQKPYLFKLYSYNDYTELRLSSEDMINLSQSIANFALDNNNIENSIEYDVGSNLYQHEHYEK